MVKHSIDMSSSSYMLNFVFLVLVVSPAISQSGTDVKSLLTNLFTTNSYNKQVRPSTNLTNPTNVYIDLYLVGIVEIDEVQEKLVTTAFLDLFWDDMFLKWTPSSYNGVQTLYIPQTEIWKPDIALQNGLSKIVEFGDAFILTKVTYDGIVMWSPYQTFETTCSIDIFYFPFDKQSCEMVFLLWTSPTTEVDIKVGKKGIMLTEFKEHGEWEVMDTSAASSTSSNGAAVVTFTLTVRRKPDYVLFNVVAPVILLSVLAIFTFAIPVDSGEKIGFCTTVYLAFAVFLTIVSASLPESSTQSLLSKYLLLLVINGTLIVIITAIQLRINFWDDSRSIPGCFVALVRFSRKVQCRNGLNKHCNIVTNVGPKHAFEKEGSVDSKERNNQVDEHAELEGEHQDTSWPDVAAAIDFYCFWFFLIVTAIATLAIFVTGYIASGI